RRLREQDITIIYISHRFKEILSQCDRATVLRNGRLVSTFALEGVTDGELIELTLGERVEQFFHADDPHATVGDVVVELEHFSVGRSVRDVSMSLRRGEI